MTQVVSIHPSKEMYGEANKIIRDCEKLSMDIRSFDPNKYLANGKRETVYEGFDPLKQRDEMTALLIAMKECGAPIIELACAVRHSMVIIKANDEVLDWRKSETDNDIPHLKEKYMYEATLAWLKERDKK